MTDFDLIVIGGGHAGVEAALAASRMGCSAALVTMDSKRLALMSCNPAIGGIGKSQLVKEVDALGGIMGEAIDATGIQFRRLNLSRGPAVWSTRVQADRIAYNKFVCDYVAATPGVTVIEGLAGEILVESGRTTGIRLETGEALRATAVVVATGTFLGGLIHIGEKQQRAGRFGEQAAHKLSESFARLGFTLGRLKTGTPPRLDGSTIDWSKCEMQPGESPIPYFSSRSSKRDFQQTPCYLTATTARTREIILANVERSPMFSGQIKAGGPRYCPSIEDKFFRFADKPSHQIFLEPEGNGTNEVYPNGFSTSLPEEVQYEAIRTVIGLENVRITRPGYAVEYDYCPTYQIKPSLETRAVAGLFFCGQINGTSGYEEAAAQGIIAGINAVQYARNEPSLILDRSEAYIGVMIDDLVTRSTTEPYRMFTSRAEYRLALREDNASDRLCDHAQRLGLISSEEYNRFTLLRAETEQVSMTLPRVRVVPELLQKLNQSMESADQRIDLAGLLRRPETEIDSFVNAAMLIPELISFSREAITRASIQCKYHGYIERQNREIERFRKLESELIPETFLYDGMVGLKKEAMEKFSRFRPSSLGQAGRIEGVTPGDVAVLSVYLKRHKSGA